ncbi:AraC family transcriptional regulator [Frankia sp. AgKG'84/4]|uniref:AraC family transcriptional regulator n=1 Tax=Frankia sp. AgKG'84/4 TaxID=573490 RepID=UPI00200D7982|nr:AraC family transcriptional regulator [Frankia sp. AgKG'84/4]MCL9794614.1 AraC family transcriptional regulator [Frankia sp. AgKG'84/4]
MDTPADPLADVLRLARVSGAVLAQLVAHEPWGVEVDPQPGAIFHAVLAGSCWLRTAETAPRQLMPGDVVLLPTNHGHTLSSGPTTAAMALTQAAKIGLRADDGVVELPGEGAITRILCASYDYDHEVAQPLMSLLPRVLHLTAGEPGDDGAVAAALALLRYELNGVPPGSRAVVARLIDVLLVHIVRAWLRTRPAGAGSWLRALHDPVTARVLALLHEVPQRAWTVHDLAAEVHVSRATLTRRFTELVGEPPLTYLTRWRMDLAAQRLRETDDPVAAIGAAVGYTSEHAFSRAFSRARGQPPRRYRLHTRTATAGSTTSLSSRRP